MLVPMKQNHEIHLTNKKVSHAQNCTTCNVLQLLFQHLTSCHVNRASCPKCRRIWNLLRLHLAICNIINDQYCQVPWCKQFKLKMQMEGKGGDDGRWRLLAKKVASVKVMSSLAKRRKEDMLNKP